MSADEDAVADEGKISGSIYSGDHEHYAFLNEVFGHYSHANVLQRDVYPERDPVRGRDHRHDRRMLMHAPEPCGVITSGGTESLMNPLLVYREWGRERGITNPNVVMPVTAHPAFDKGAHYFGIELRKATVTDQFVVDMDSVRVAHRRQHRRPGRLCRHLPAWADRPDRGSCRRSPSSAGSTCTSTAASAGSSSAGASRWAPGPGLRLPPPRRHVDQRRHPQVRLRAEGHRACCCTEPPSCAGCSTSSRPIGRVGCTRRRG